MEIVEINYRKPYKKPLQFLEEAKSLAERWSRNGLLDRLGNKFEKQIAAVLLENQRLLNEQHAKSL